ncbi:unnamed protein product [Prorocentrum cordatum]|uniref:Core-binding (CB) domain-containing protein n=1 Tax=Prorocentrum cordatum TaxID=2364126 RepID=A0ABN9R1Z9_9DINO|nr:unnamed protein product [Polarella glacialis]
MQPFGSSRARWRPARLRTLEHCTITQIYLKKDHQLVETGKTQYANYLAKIQEEGSSHNRGPPESQLFGACLSDIESWLGEDSCQPSLKRYRGVADRLLNMLRHSDPELAS